MRDKRVQTSSEEVLGALGIVTIVLHLLLHSPANSSTKTSPIIRIGSDRNTFPKASNQRPLRARKRASSLISFKVTFNISFQFPSFSCLPSHHVPSQRPSVRAWPLLRRATDPWRPSWDGPTSGGSAGIFGGFLQNPHAWNRSGLK